MTKKSIKDALYPIILTSATLGLIPIYYARKNGIRKWKIYSTLQILAAIYTMVYTYLTYAAFGGLSNVKLHPNYAAGVSKIGLIFQLLAQIALVYIIYFFNVFQGEKTLKSLEDIEAIDERFEDLGIKFNYHKHFNYEIAIIVTGFAAISIRAFLNYSYINRNVVAVNDYMYIIFTFPSLVSFLLQTQFALLVNFLHERFTMINKQLEFLAAMKYEPIKFHKNEFSHLHAVKRIELLMDLHDHLIDVGNLINHSFTIQILTTFTAQFLTEVFTVFYLYYESIVLKNKTAAINWFGWAVFTALEIFHVTVNCHLTSKESKSTGVAVHKVLMDESDAVLRKKLAIFSQQICHRPLQFSACGLFPIDATLLFTITGAAATYLLIMLQFQEGIESQCSKTHELLPL